MTSGTTSAFEHHRAIVDGGHHLHYVTVGRSGPPVVFIHGYADSWRSFEPQLPALAASFRVFAYDQRGHGDSDLAPTEAIGVFVDDAISFIEKIVGEASIVIGHSLGGIVAQRIAVRRPDLVKALVLVGTAPTAAGHAGIAELIGELDAIKGQAPAELIEAFQTGTTVKPLAAGRLADILSESAKLDIAAWRGTARALVNDPDGVSDPVIATSSLVLWGDQDPIFDAESQRRLANRLADVSFVSYPSIGHAPNWEVPEAVSDDILRFLRRKGFAAPSR